MVAGTPIFLATKAVAIPALPPSGGDGARKRGKRKTCQVEADHAEAAVPCENVERMLECHLTSRQLLWTGLLAAARSRGGTAELTCLGLVVGSCGVLPGVRRSYLLAQVPNAADLEGARGLRVLHLQVDSGADEL